MGPRETLYLSRGDVGLIMQLVLLSTDLMLSSALHGIARRHNASLSIVANAAAALEQCTERDLAACVADLRHLDVPIDQFVADLRARAVAETLIVAVDQHVHEHRLEAARAAGCDAVLTRGEIERRLGELLAKFSGS